MNKKFVFKAILASIFLIIITTQKSFSDEENIGTQEFQLTSGFTIQNETGSTIIFNLSTDNKNWDLFSIESGRVLEFDCGTQYILIISNSGRVNYKINCNERTRYSIEWNRERQLWDFYSLE